MLNRLKLAYLGNAIAVSAVSMADKSGGVSSTADKSSADAAVDKSAPEAPVTAAVVTLTEDEVLWIRSVLEKFHTNDKPIPKVNPLA